MRSRIPYFTHSSFCKNSLFNNLKTNEYKCKHKTFAVNRGVARVKHKKGKHLLQGVTARGLGATGILFSVWARRGV